MGRRPCCEKVGLKKGRWTAEEDEILSKYIEDNGEGSWRSLPKNAGLLRCGKSCRLRWINYLRSDLKRGNISSHEEDVIARLHASLGNRSDRRIYCTLGQAEKIPEAWSLIASHLPGRTDNEIKNYWNSHLCRKILVFRRPASSETLPFAVDDGVISKRTGGRTSRQAEGTSECRSSNESPLSSSSKPVNRDITLLSATEPEKETLADVNERESDGEKHSHGEPSTGSCKSDERESEISMQREIGTEKEQLGSSINGGLLTFNESVESGSMDIEWFLTLSEDGSNDDSCYNKIAVSQEEENNGEWRSLLSVASSFEDPETWGWESLVQGNEQWNEGETTMPSLWEEDNWKLQRCENVEQKL